MYTSEKGEKAFSRTWTIKQLMEAHKWERVESAHKPHPIS